MRTIDFDEPVGGPKMLEDLVKLAGEGLILEFGVAEGHSFRRICGAAAPRLAFGFDWFYGLPEDWKPENPRGCFSTGGRAPKDLPQNGHIVLGLVEATIDDFVRRHPHRPVAFAHLDMDLYGPTKKVLTAIAPRLVDGSILVFDEISGHPAHHANEGRALLEILDEVEYLDVDCVSDLGASGARAYVVRSSGPTRATLWR